MIADAMLQRIRTGEATPKEAHQAIRKLLAEQGPKSTPSIYAALRGFTWHALQQRRFDGEMEDWYKVIRGAGAAVAKQDGRNSNYMEALSHLVDESLRYAASHNWEQLVVRSHVGAILDIINRHNGRIERDQLKVETGLRDSRLSQLLGELQLAGAIERTKEGRNALFTLTDSGRELHQLWLRSQLDRSLAADERYRRYSLAEVQSDPGERDSAAFPMVWCLPQQDAGVGPRRAVEPSGRVQKETFPFKSTVREEPTEVFDDAGMADRRLTNA